MEDTFLLLTIALKKSWIYQVRPLISSTPLISSSPTKNKVPNREFTGVPIMNFMPDWEFENLNQCGLQKTDVIAQK